MLYVCMKQHILPSFVLLSLLVIIVKPSAAKPATPEEQIASLREEYAIRQNEQLKQAIDKMERKLKQWNSEPSTIQWTFSTEGCPRASDSETPGTKEGV